MEKEEITIAEIERLSGLSGLELTAKEKQVLVSEVKDVIDMLNGCAKVSTAENLESTSCGLNDLRDDEVRSSMDEQDVFMAAPKTKEGYFVVPKVVD